MVRNLLSKIRNQLLQLFLPGSFLRYFFFRHKRSLLFRLGCSQIIRSKYSNKPNLLLVDDDLPAENMGAGFPRTLKLISTLVDLDCHVIFLPTLRPAVRKERARNLERIGCEIVYPDDYGLFFSFQSFIKSRLNELAMIIISRPHNARALQPVLKGITGKLPILYDAEALFIHRHIYYMKNVLKKTLSENEVQSLVNSELNVAGFADAIITVSKNDANLFQKRLNKPAYVLSHKVKVCTRKEDFQQRTGLLFVGSIKKNQCPNADAVEYFVREIYPYFKKNGYPEEVSIIGKCDSASLLNKYQKTVNFYGSVDSLLPYYDSHKVFIAPTRYAAGIPLKVIDACAAGLPSVITPILADQLGWTDGVHTLVADTPDDFFECCISLIEDKKLWSKISRNAQKKIQEDFSEIKFKSQVIKIVNRYV